MFSCKLFDVIASEDEIANVQVIIVQLCLSQHTNDNLIRIPTCLEMTLGLLVLLEVAYR